MQPPTDAALRAAVKHLFRHLDEPRALRKNVLVRRFFEDSSIGNFGRLREREVLARVHRLIRQAAEHCRDLDLSNGDDDERALRRHTIVTLQCLENQPMEAVAAKLGVSLGYCYRERAQIYLRIARYLSNYVDRPRISYLPEVDDFQVRVHRVLHYATFGDVDIAFRECDSLVADALPGYQKIEALRTNAFTSMRFGAVDRAEHASAAATDVWQREKAAQTPVQRDAGAACLALLGAQFAYYRGNVNDALALARRAVTSFEALETTSPHLKELYAESRGELGSSLCNAGEWERGHDELADAETQLGRARCASSQLAARVTLEVWMLRTYLPLGSRSWYPARERMEGLTKAFELSYSSGSLIEATVALRVLAEFHAMAGNERELLDTTRQTMLLAKNQPSERIRVQTALNLAVLLLMTRHWRSASALVPNASQLDSCDAYHRQLAEYFAAAWALKSGSLREAWKLANSDGGRAGSSALLARRRIVGASAAYELGKKRDAQALAEMAVTEAERFGLAPLLKEAYQVAATAIGGAQYKRRAREIADVICA